MNHQDSMKEGDSDDDDDLLLTGDLISEGGLSLDDGEERESIAGNHLDSGDGKGGGGGGSGSDLRSLNSLDIDEKEDEKENSFASIVVARFGNSAQQLLRFLKYKGVSGENDLAKVDENEIVEVARREGLKAIQLNKLREWVRSLHPGSSSRSSITLSKQNATLLKALEDDIESDETEPDGGEEDKAEGGGGKVSKSKRSIALESSNDSSGISTPTPSAMFNGGYKSQLFPNLESRSSLVEARFIADAMGFGWDGVGFDLYWEMMERRDVFASSDWPLTGNPLVTMLLLQRFLDKNDQFKKYIHSLSKASSAKVDLITAQHKMEMEEVGRALPKPSIIANFETSWICPPSLVLGNSVNNYGAGGCMQLIDMLGMSARVYFLLDRFEDAEEASKLGLEMDDYQQANSPNDNGDINSNSKNAIKNRKSRVKKRLSKLMATSSGSNTTSGNNGKLLLNGSGTGLKAPSIRIHCKRVLALLSLQLNNDLIMAESHYKQAIEDAQKLDWHSMELLLIMDLKERIYTQGSGREEEAESMMDAVCKKMKMAKPEVLSLFS